MGDGYLRFGNMITITIAVDFREWSKLLNSDKIKLIIFRKSAIK